MKLLNEGVHAAVQARSNAVARLDPIRRELARDDAWAPVELVEGDLRPWTEQLLGGPVGQYVEPYAARVPGGFLRKDTIEEKVFRRDVHASSLSLQQSALDGALELVPDLRFVDPLGRVSADAVIPVVASEASAQKLAQFVQQRPHRKDSSTAIFRLPAKVPDELRDGYALAQLMVGGHPLRIGGDVERAASWVQDLSPAITGIQHGREFYRTEGAANIAVANSHRKPPVDEW